MSKRIYDLNRYRKIYPLIRRKPVYAELDSKIIESVRIRYQPGEYSKVYAFKKPFTESPICVATAENENLNAFIVAVDLNSVTIEISSPAPSYLDAPPVYVHLQIINRTSLEDL